MLQVRGRAGGAPHLYSEESLGSCCFILNLAPMGNGAWCNVKAEELLKLYTLGAEREQEELRCAVT